MAKKKKPKKTVGVKKQRASAKKAQRHPLVWGLKWLATFMVWGVIALMVFLGIYGYNLPDVSTLTERDNLSPSVEILSARGELLSNYGPLMREPLSYADFPVHLVRALLAVEDRDFFNHGGLDFWALLRAMTINLYEGRVVQGGSTLTQQLVKNLYLTNERSMDRKVREAILAFWIERKLSKEEILTLYLNRVYFGAGAYGVDAASSRFFGKSARDLTLPEAALIVGLVKAPSDLNPLRSPEKAIDRRNVVLQEMLESGFITRHQSNQAKQARMAIRRPLAGPNVRFFTDWIMEQLPYYVNSKDHAWLRVDTTLDLNAQNRADLAAENIMNRYALDHNVSQVGTVTLRPSGAVVSMVGGISYDFSQFNHATQAKRQPGSAFKTFVVLEALTRGFTPTSLLEDTPLTIKTWKPQNFQNQFHGTVTLREAFVKSYNIPHIRLMQAVGVRPVLARARSMGISSPLRPDLSTALGSSEVSLMELTTAYAVLRNQGHLVLPFGITRVVDQSGNVLYQRKGSEKTRRLVDEPTVATMDSLLRAAVEDPAGTGRTAQLPSQTAAGKTGTSQDERDAWFVGYTDALITGVWMGNDDRTPMDNVTGGTLPTMLWRDMMVSGGKR
jgi:penicillin-binding protein 1A